MAEPGARTSVGADRLLERLSTLGVSHLLGVPDNWTAPLFEPERCARFGLATLTVSREGEAFAIAAGLWLGGKRAVVVIQNTGLLESGDAIRGTVQRMGVPLLCLVGYRGFPTRGAEPAAGLPGSDAAETDRGRRDALTVLTDASLDSAAALTAPTLGAWRLPFVTLGDDPGLVESAWRRAEREQRPVVVLVTGALGAC